VFSGSVVGQKGGKVLFILLQLVFPQSIHDLLMFSSMIKLLFDKKKMLRRPAASFDLAPQR